MSAPRGDGPGMGPFTGLSGPFARVRNRSRFADMLVAVVGIAGELDLRAVLQRIVELAADLVPARYGALAIAASDGELERFFWTGLSADEARAIGPFPLGRGLLGELLTRDGPLRLDDLTAYPAAAGFPRHHPPMRTFLGVPVTDGERTLGSLYLTERSDGEPFSAEDESLLQLFAAAAAIALSNARRYEASREQERWLTANYGLTHDLLAGTHPDSRLDTIIRTARQLTDADYAVLFHIDPTGEHLVVRVADGPEADSTIGRVLPIEASRAGQVFTTGNPMVVRDLWRDTRRAPWLSDTLPQLGPAALVPLGLADNALGVVVVTRLRDRLPFPDGTLRMLESFAHQAAVALHLARERTWRERVSVYADRERIAHDLHDQVIQRLFATGMLLQGTARLTVRPEVRERLSRAVHDLDETVRQIRATIYELENPPVRTGDDVRAALLAVTDQAVDTLGYAPLVRFFLPADLAVPAGVRENLVAAARELLANVARHASAGRVEVELAADGGVLTLTVTDDGVGLPASGRRSGLRHLSERAAALGGELVATARPAGGTEVVWRVPLDPET
ncbi:sensor histidine kinase [Actinocatenispora rupis]|uniref:Histidine kinase n=1 Tax=Actinocatenispora rupis TaxID=519421 RepID=A0A8J3JCU7_9ACTN|nr:GAF domain-containing protein [Actinocatenispora rupis]GID14379.1 histidine kinase [Actinocatenispora rupis]